MISPILIITILAVIVQPIYIQILRRKLNSEQELADTMLSDSNMFVVIWNSDGTIKYINEYMELKTGFSAAELIGRNWLSMFVDEADLHNVKNDIEGLIRKEISADYLQPIKCKTGEYMDIEWNSRVIHNSEDQYYVISMGIDVSEMVKASAFIDKLTNYHNLTDLPNRTKFIEKVNYILNQKKDQTYKAAVLFVDVDNFADMNNAYGYKFGDELLINIGEVLNARLHGNEFLAHYDGDCFALFLPDIRNARNAINKAKRIIKTFHLPWFLDKHECYSTVSVGISIYPEDGKNSEELIKNAESALLFANKNGRSKYQLYSKEIDTQVTKRLDIEYNLRRAIENEEFVLYYQPQVDITTGKILSVEALIRWIHPKDGFIAPSEFIPVADETGLINPIGEWVLKTACRQIKTINDMIDSKITLAVNLSPSQFQNMKLSDDIFNIIRSTHFDPELLEIEVTEEAAIKDINATIRLLRKLGSRKIKIALDDFCTGYSSLCYLELLPINKIKIDKSFIDDMINNYKKEVIVESLIALAHKLGISVVAEGVEQMTQNDLLKQKKCDMVQGYYFSKPLPYNDLIKCLGSWQTGTEFAKSRSTGYCAD